MTPLGEILAKRIRLAGPMTVAEFMAEAVNHPQLGYYKQGDVFGLAGDFITSPEIQARVIVERNGWYPGIDGQHVLPHVSDKAKALLFQSTPPE